MPDRKSIKLAVARLLSLTLLDRALIAARGRANGGAFIRAVNYHGTPAEWAESFEAQLRYLARRFASVTLADLAGLLDRGTWPHPRPGLLLSFDDGLRSNYDVARPLLERYGFTGWFFVPTAFIDCSIAEQAAFARSHSINLVGQALGDGRVAMTWDEIGDLDRNHVVGCHTRTHRRLIAGTTPQQLDEELIESKRTLESQLGHPVDSFCWVGGEEHAITPAAADRVRDANFRYAFMTASTPITATSDPQQLHRTNIEADWPLPLVRLQLCGLADWANAPKRRRIRRLLSPARADGTGA